MARINVSESREATWEVRSDNSEKTDQKENTKLNIWK
jgi:hypothetical protein